jgi:hypothetical protein
LLQVHGGTEGEGWAALEAARNTLREQLAQSMRRRIAAGRLEPLSEQEIQERAQNAYNDSIQEQVRCQRRDGAAF